jgi:exoribonuclease R
VPWKFSLITPLPTLYQSKTQALVEESWYPRLVDDDDDEEDATLDVELQSVDLAANLIRRKLTGTMVVTSQSETSEAATLARGRFLDLTCQPGGETILERLFHDELAARASSDVVLGAIMTLQSLCIMGTLVGVKGPPDQLRMQVSHLSTNNDDNDDKSEEWWQWRDLHTWDRESVRRLKFRRDKAPGMQLLAALLRKRSMQGALDLLVELGVWNVHEDVALIRSGFPLRFTDAENKAAREAKDYTHDPDTILGLREDLRNMKVYTIDGPSTSEIDDGLSVEKEVMEDGSERLVYWIHIADADRWAPRGSALFEAARRRITSVYLPNKSLSMFPAEVSTDTMSVKARHDAHALSLKVCLHEDGSVDTSSVEVVPSLIHVDYRLTYSEVDEMLEEGIGYREEWQLGTLLAAAQKRRQYRIQNGSTEGVVPNPIPAASVSVYPDSNELDEVGISLQVQVSHNAGINQTSGAESPNAAAIDPVSSANVLVTEAMILAGEALGHWKERMDQGALQNQQDIDPFVNNLRLPFRTQSAPDWKSRARERRLMMDLLEYNVGGGYCHAWYTRRFFSSVRVTEQRLPHAGLGLQSYVQWTSPIRRFSDLQVHCAVKRYLRRRRILEWIRQGTITTIPMNITAMDLGLPDGCIQDGKFVIHVDRMDIDGDINYLENIGLMGVVRKFQREAQQYWMYEYIRRLVYCNPNKEFTAVILGCVDAEKHQYAIYVYELGLEHRMTFPARMDAGVSLILRVDKVAPKHAQLIFVRTNS